MHLRIATCKRWDVPKRRDKSTANHNQSSELIFEV